MMNGWMSPPFPAASCSRCAVVVDTVLQASISGKSSLKLNIMRKMC